MNEKEKIMELARELYAEGEIPSEQLSATYFNLFISKLSVI